MDDESDPSPLSQAAKEQYARVCETFLRCKPLTGRERAAALDAIGAQDAALRREVEELLRASEIDGDDALSDRRVDAREALAPWHSKGRGEVFPRDPERVAGFRVLRRIGEGGMGVVYEAEQDAPRRRVALKLVRPGLAFGERLRRFRVEAEALGRLQHPGIAQIFEFGTCDLGSGEQPYFAMELVDGEPLLVHVARANLDRRARLELVAELCDAVQHAHERGVVHRDLKPDNVLVDADGRAKVLDFGVARVRSNEVELTTIHTAQGQIVGTLTHMAPEQLGGDPDAIGPATDVYALGVIAFELLTGRLPHEVAGLSLTAAVRHITEADPPRLGILDRSLRGDLETIVAKCLDADPERRYVSPAALASDLRRFLGSEPIAARPAGPIYRAHKFARRNPWLVGAISALGFGLLGTLGFALVAQQQRRASQASQTREAEANSELRNALYTAETRNASAAAQAYNGIASLQEYVARWAPLLATEDDEARPGPWEFRLFERMAHDPHVAVKCSGLGGGAVSPEGLRLATGGAGRVTVRDAENGAILQVLPALEEPQVGDPVYDLAWDRTGARIAAIHDGQGLFVWDLAEGRSAWSFAPEGELLLGVEWGGPSNRLFSVTRSRKLRCHDGATGQVLWTRAALALTDEGMQLSRDGSLLAVGLHESLALCEEGGDGEPLRVLRAPMNAIAWSPDGLRIAAADLTGGVEVLDVTRGDSLARFQAHDKRVQRLCWSPDGTLLATASWDFSIALWDTRDWREVRRLRADDEAIGWVCWSADGRTLISGTLLGTLRFWPVAGVTARRRGWFRPGMTHEEVGISLHPDGVRVLTTHRVVESWRLDEPLPRGGGSSVLTRMASWNATAQRVALREPAQVLVADATDMRVLTSFSIPEGYVTTCAWHPTDPGRLAIGGSASVAVLDVDRHASQVRWQAQPGHTSCLGWTVDGTALLATFSDGPRLIDPATGQILKQLETKQARSLAFSPDGRSFALGLVAGDVLIFELASFELKGRLHGHSNEVWGLAWHPSEPRLASAGGDGRVLLWDTERHELVASLDPGGPMGSVAWSRDGEQLITLTQTGLLSVWDATLGVKKSAQ